MPKQIKTSLAYLRFVRRMSQKAVSEATGVGQKTLSALETGVSKGIEFNTMLRLCEFFKCTPGDLFVIEEESEYIPVSDKARRVAEDLVSRGLQAAMLAPPADPDKVWADFDAVRVRVQESAGRAAIERASLKNRKLPPYA
jgi:DNA-binding Xre family transcriptional regulator